MGRELRRRQNQNVLRCRAFTHHDGLGGAAIRPTELRFPPSRFIVAPAPVTVLLLGNGPDREYLKCMIVLLLSCRNDTLQKQAKGFYETSMSWLTAPVDSMCKCQNLRRTDANMHAPTSACPKQWGRWPWVAGCARGWGPGCTLE